MKRIFESSRARFLLLTVGVLIAVAVGQFVVHAVEEARLAALFDGPCELCTRQRPTYFPRPTYRVEKYKALSETSGQNFAKTESEFATEAPYDEISYVDGEDREDVETAIRQGGRVDGMTGATPVSRLRAPSAYRDRRPFERLQIVYPEDGTLFPPNFCAPYLEWEDAQNSLWQVLVDFGQTDEEFTDITEKRRWRFPRALWEGIQENAIAADVTVQIKGVQVNESGERVNKVQVSEPIHFRISEDPADSYIVYRLVPPPFSSLKTPDIFVRDIRKDEPELFLSARRSYCINCHTFSSKEGNKGKLGLQIRSLRPGGNKLPVYLAYYDMEKRTGRKLHLPFDIQMSTFMAWSPDETKLAFSANQKIVAFKPIVYETQLAGMSASDIAIYDANTNETYLMPGASDPNFLEIYPRWSPDGSQLVFARSAVGNHPAHILFDLCAIAMGPKRETEARSIEDASDNEKSNYYPRFSPDGRWFSFCRCDGGDLIRSSSDIYLKRGDLQGPAHCLECNYPYAGDSWHSWSSNGRWLVFASKREGGIYAYLYLTHIDDEGHASPAVRLPLKEIPYASFNIPEFVANYPEISENELFEAIRVESQAVPVRKKIMAKG